MRDDFFIVLKRRLDETTELSPPEIGFNLNGNQPGNRVEDGSLGRPETKNKRRTPLKRRPAQKALAHVAPLRQFACSAAFCVCLFLGDLAFRP